LQYLDHHEVQSMQALAEGCQIGPYRIVSQLGEGGMGAVFEAVHVAIERHVAIKVLRPEHASHPDMVGRFFNEARAVNLIDHPSIVQVADFGHTADGLSFIVMELVRGEALSKRLRSGALGVAQAVDLARQLAGALGAAHEKNIVHRDLKPDNLMLVADPERLGAERLKVLDFGIAKLMESERAGTIRTRANLVMGTPAYMSPEQCRGASHVDTKADVYSLGVILYEMLAGRLPFVADDSGSLIGMHLFKTPPPLKTVAPQVPEPLAALVDRLLHKDKEQRPSMRELVEQLRLLEQGTTPLSSQPGSGWRTALRRTFLPQRASSSTLGLVTGQLGGQRRGSGQRRHAARAAVVLGMLVAGSLAYLGVSVRSPAPSRPRPAVEAARPTAALVPVAPAGPLSPSPPRMVRWDIASDPPGAEVVRVSDGVVLGKTPLAHQQPAQSARMLLSLRLAGYQPAELTLDQDIPGQVDKRLLPVRSAATATPSRGRQPPRSPPVGATPAHRNPMETPYVWPRPKETDLLEK
jgi:serine/threonine-protein kinase